MDDLDSWNFLEDLSSCIHMILSKKKNLVDNFFEKKINKEPNV